MNSRICTEDKGKRTNDMKNQIFPVIIKIFRRPSLLILIMKYCIFLAKYFDRPLTIFKEQIKRQKVQVATLRGGETINSFGYGDVSWALYRIWADHEYGIRPKDVKKFRTVVDIGAHIGLFSVFCGVLNPRCKVFCFEIEKGNYRHLKQNIESCNVNNVISFNLAVTDKSGVVDYYSGRDSSEFSTTKISFSDGSKPTADEDLTPIGRGKSVTLDEVLEENSLDSVDFLKLDCEGAEFEILYATSEESIKKLIEMGGEYHEYGEYTVDDLIVYLSKFGDTKTVEMAEGVGLFHYTSR